MIRNMLEYFNVCLLDFCVIQILMSTIVIIECISWLNKYEGWNFNSGNYLFTIDTK